MVSKTEGDASDEDDEPLLGGDENDFPGYGGDNDGYDWTRPLQLRHSDLATAPLQERLGVVYSEVYVLSNNNFHFYPPTTIKAKVLISDQTGRAHDNCYLYNNIMHVPLDHFPRRIIVDE